MIVDTQIQQYLNLLDHNLPSWLEGIREAGIKDSVPIMKKESLGLLRILIKLYQPQSILEVGTAIGFSALGMLEAGDKRISSITTLELDTIRAMKARAYFDIYDKDKKIHLIEGDALKTLDMLSGEFDFVLLDAAKGQYDICLEKILPKLKKGGVIISDNILQEGETALSRYVVRRRDRTIHKRMREYLHKLMNDERILTQVVAIGDGLAISIKS